MNNNTGQIEVGLVEEVYTDKENTDTPVLLKSSQNAPHVISLGVIVDEGGDTEALPVLPLLDASPDEMLCLDQILHIAASLTSDEKVKNKLKIHSIVQSKGEAS